MPFLRDLARLILYLLATWAGWAALGWVMWALG